MRGPGLRSSLDVRRHWRCPRCGYERRAPGWETTVHCHCTRDEPLMQLIEPVRKVKPAPAELDLNFEYEPTPEEIAADAAAAEQRALSVQAEIIVPSEDTASDEPGEESVTVIAIDAEVLDQSDAGDSIAADPTAAPVDEVVPADGSAPDAKNSSRKRRNRRRGRRTEPRSE